MPCGGLRAGFSHECPALAGAGPLHGTGPVGRRGRLGRNAGHNVRESEADLEPVEINRHPRLSLAVSRPMFREGVLQKLCFLEAAHTPRPGFEGAEGDPAGSFHPIPAGRPAAPQDLCEPPRWLALHLPLCVLTPLWIMPPSHCAQRDLLGAKTQPARLMSSAYLLTICSVATWLRPPASPAQVNTILRVGPLCLAALPFSFVSKCG